LDGGQQAGAWVVDENCGDPLFTADTQEPTPGAADIAVARCPGLRLEDADADDIDRTVHGLEQTLDVQDRAGPTLAQRQPEPDRRMGRPRSKPGAETVRLHAGDQRCPKDGPVIVTAERVRPHLDEAEAEATQRADGERIGVDPTTEADRADQRHAI